LSPFSEAANAGLSVDSFLTQPVSLRIIPFQTYSGIINMAVDTWFAMHQSDREGILRFYGWKPYCISIGYHQDMKILDLEKVHRAASDIVRRPTGGRAIYHAEELTYSIILPKSVIGHRELYLFIHRILANALRQLGYMVELKSVGAPMSMLRQMASDYACFTSSAYSEIQYMGRKVVGSAQKIYKKTNLQHGSVIIGKAHLNLADFLLAGSAERICIEKELREKTISLSEIREGNILPQTIMQAIITQIKAVQNISVYSKKLTTDEIRLATKCIVN